MSRVPLWTIVGFVSPIIIGILLCTYSDDSILMKIIYISLMVVAGLLFGRSFDEEMKQ